MGLGRSTDQCIIVAVGAAGRSDGHDHGMVECGRMLSLPTAGVAGDAIAAADRDSRLQVQSGGVRVTVDTIVQVGSNHRTIIGRTRIVTVQTGSCPASHITESHMVDVPGQGLVRMAIQAMGRGGTQCEGVDDLLTLAVMTGGAGTGSVGRNIVLDLLNLSIGRDIMAGTAELARCIIGEVIGSDCH